MRRHGNKRAGINCDISLKNFSSTERPTTEQQKREKKGKKEKTRKEQMMGHDRKKRERERRMDEMLEMMKYIPVIKFILDFSHTNIGQGSNLPRTDREEREKWQCRMF